NSIAYNYSSKEPIVEIEQGSYADKDAPISSTQVWWNHGLGEVIGSLIRNGLTISLFKEFDYSPYNIFSGSIEMESGRYRIEKLRDKIPLVYAVIAERPANK